MRIVYLPKHIGHCTTNTEICYLFLRIGITPLASIIGSGFLVSAPLVVLTTGSWAGFAMLGIVLVAYCLGSVMRFNIQYLEPYLVNDRSSKIIIPLEAVSHPTLGIAYMISVAFYLKLLSVFAMKGVGIHSATAENILTTFILLFIAAVGWFGVAAGSPSWVGSGSVWSRVW